MAASPFSNVRVVLLETTHPGNVGASARAMKAMGLDRLSLVNPSRFPSVEATAMASGADDLLVHAEVCRSLGEALRDCGLVVGTSARERTLPWPTLDPRAAAGRIMGAAAHSNVALVFGREQSGLTNDEVEFCQFLVRIPTAPEFSSLNLAAAVQIMAYELRQATLSGEIARSASTRRETPAATTEQMEQLYTHLEQVMTEVAFFDAQKPRYLMRRLKRLFNRARLDQNETNILRGFLAAVQAQRRQTG